MSLLCETHTRVRRVPIQPKGFLCGFLGPLSAPEARKAVSRTTEPLGSSGSLRGLLITTEHGVSSGHDFHPPQRCLRRFSGEEGTLIHGEGTRGLV